MFVLFKLRFIIHIFQSSQTITFSCICGEYFAALDRLDFRELIG